MMPPAHLPWAPTRFEFFKRGLDTSMGTAEIETDAGPAYIKAMGNRQGPHPLACELVATRLARWFGLATLDEAVMYLTETDEVPFVRGGKALSGPAFVTRKMALSGWGGAASDLTKLVNLADISRLVVFDTWTLNCDRHPADLAVRRPHPDNVFMATEGLDKQLRLIAADHSHCFTCGRDITVNVSDIDRVKDERIYGLFPEFEGHLREEPLRESQARLRECSSEMLREVLNAVPREWEVSGRALAALGELICRRASFVADEVVNQLVGRLALWA